MEKLIIKAKIYRIPENVFVSKKKKHGRNKEGSRQNHNNKTQKTCNQMLLAIAMQDKSTKFNQRLLSAKPGH